MPTRYLTIGENHYALIQCNERATRYDRYGEPLVWQFTLFGNRPYHTRDGWLMRERSGWSRLHSLTCEHRRHFLALERTMTKIAMLDAMSRVL
ncbi:MAG: hypothetical protein ACR2J8_02235 [Thermomicrobiales bacterium]